MSRPSPNKSITVRRANERGKSSISWLESYHSFSFGEYYDSKYMGFRSLRVINDDTVAPGAGFGRHPHNNMEIVSLVVSGTLKHEDSLGNGGIIKAFEAQKITAGSGIIHSEFNPSEKEPVHFLQIWIMPSKKNLEPNYEQLNLKNLLLINGLILFAAQEGQNVLHVNQDVKIYYGNLKADEKINLAVGKGRAGWFQVIDGKMDVGGESVQTGDGVSMEEGAFTITAESRVQFLFFDLK